MSSVAIFSQSSQSFIGNAIRRLTHMRSVECTLLASQLICLLSFCHGTQFRFMKWTRCRSVCGQAWLTRYSWMGVAHWMWRMIALLLLLRLLTERVVYLCIHYTSVWRAVNQISCPILGLCIGHKLNTCLLLLILLLLWLWRWWSALVIKIAFSSRAHERVWRLWVARVMPLLHRASESTLPASRSLVESFSDFSDQVLFLGLRN